MPAPIDFKKLFADKAKYPDTIKIKIGDDSELELGVLRAYNESASGALVTELESQRKELLGEADKIDKARKEVASQYLDVMKLKEQYEKNPPKGGGNEPPPDPYADLTDDPIVNKLAKLVKSQTESHAAELKSIREENKKLLDAIGKMGVTYMNDRAAQDYNGIPEDPDFDAKDTNLTRESLYNSAVKNGWRDASGIPDVKKAYKEATSDKRVARLVKEAEERGAKNAAEERRVNAMLPKPSNGRAPGVAPPQYKDINGALEAAMDDKEIWAAIPQ